MSSRRPKGEVVLVGAGPGDAELITVKGLKYLQRADVIVYDRLAGEELLRYARPEAKIIYAGKSPEGHTMRQEEINQLLIREAQEGKLVVRLKGGDPFVFGRGGEEASALVAAGVPFRVVPGVTSAVAVPAYAGIPVTDRRFAASFTVVTGNEEPGKEESNINWESLARNTGTLVFLMGMRNLRVIVDKLLAAGRVPETPVAVIQWGTTPRQSVAVGTLTDISAKVEEAGITNPAIIVVGEVVSLRRELNWYERLPLFGKKILVTRSREQASELSRLLSDLGAEPLEFPTIAIEPLNDYSAIDRAIININSYRWLIFTSVNGVKFFWQRWQESGGKMEQLAGINVVAIGPKTAAALQERGIRATILPEKYQAEEIVDRIRPLLLPGDRVLLPRASIARPELAVQLREAGAVVDEIAVYRTVPAVTDREKLHRLLVSGTLDAITFTSSSTVVNFYYLLAGSSHAEGVEEWEDDTGRAVAELLSRTTIACIGPITAATARRYGLRVDVVAAEYTIEGLVAALVEHFTNRKQGADMEVK